MVKRRSCRMRKNVFVFVLTAILIALGIPLSYSASLDWLTSKVNTATTTKLSDTQVGSGLKEALKVGIENTIKLLGQKDGYLGNQGVKILLPQTLKSVEPALRKVGFGPKIDEFTLSMNRAAEKAAPLASDIFASAITGISFDDAQKILNGGNTAATEYLRNATSARILDAFGPAVGQAMNEYEVTKKYQELLSKAQTLPFVSRFSGNLDIAKYVSGKALDGLFKVLAQQEANIRTNPAAQVTDLLKQVFSK